MGRHARESMPPAEYLSSTYYEIWLSGLEKLLLRDRPGQRRRSSLRALARMPATPVTRVLTPRWCPRCWRSAADSERPAAAPARFAVGDLVVTRNMHPMGHTRLPAMPAGSVA